MKTKSLLALFLAPLAAFSQTADIVSIGAGYTEQVWYDLETGTEYSADANEWDIAFEMHGISASIITNSQKAGFRLYEAPLALSAWNSFDTTDWQNWNQPLNSPEDWSVGAFNKGVDPSDPFDLGWGTYDIATHVTSGDSLYLLKLASGELKKLKIEALTGGAYYFTFANVDGTNEVSTSVDKADYPDKGFVYYSLEDELVLDREPLNTVWDLTFVRYTDMVPIEYGVTGVLLNKFETTAEKVAGVEVGTAQFASGFTSQRNLIGWDWKNFNVATFMWEIQDSLTYFVQTSEGNIVPIVFTDFGGSATGEFFFNHYPAVVGVQELSTGVLNTYPNPTSGLLNIQLPVGVGQATVIIRDMSARVAVQEQTGNSAALHTMDVSGLRSGLYMVEMLSNNGVFTAKILVD